MSIRNLFVCLIFLLLTPNLAAAYCCSAPTNTLKICQETAPSSPLDFGTFEQNVPASVASANYNPVIGGLSLNNLTQISGGQISSLGVMTICGRVAQLVNLQWPTTLNLNSSSNSLSIQNITAAGTSIGTISISARGIATCLLSTIANPGLCQFKIGATASLVANQTGGLYTNTLTFTVN